MAWFQEAIGIDLLDLVVVEFRDQRQIHTRVAFSCRYIPIELATGRRVLVVELLFDPFEQQPQAAYGADGYEQIFVAPRALVRIRPYLE